MAEQNQIFTIGYIIPTFDKNQIDFYEGRSLMDADILLISPDALEPRGSWVNFTVRDGGCYDVDASKTYKEKMSALKKEVEDHLNAGKNIFILLTKKEMHSLSTGVSTEKKGMTTYHSDTLSNYNFLPIDLGTLTSVAGTRIEFKSNPLFSDFYTKFGKNLEYQLYIENSKGSQVIFTGKDRNKILGAIYKVGKGNLIALPYIKYNREEFIEYRGKGEKKKEYWNKEAIQFGKSLVRVFADIDKSLRKGGDKTPPPDWVSGSEFQLVQEQVLKRAVEEKSNKIEELVLQKSDLLTKIDQEVQLKDLLFENGKVLENAIKSALEILGYKAKNYNDGTLEMDHIITSPEGDRFIGEAEGKDTSAVSIDKFRQLATNIHEDLQRDEVKEPAIGILFGNGFRLTKPTERAEQFTTKCISTAKSSNCILIRTVDLFRIAKYVKETRNEIFAKSCRDTIKLNIGKIVQFPDLPNAQVASI